DPRLKADEKRDEVDDAEHDATHRIDK
ncbi:MAG: hypothetical protein QOK18_1403, partial [Mycobacterium sp.]|nr:hypothetical protein [Mycobacterium sp.]